MPIITEVVLWTVPIHTAHKLAKECTSNICEKRCSDSSTLSLFALILVSVPSSVCPLIRRAARASEVANESVVNGCFQYTCCSPGTLYSNNGKCTKKCIFVRAQDSGLSKMRSTCDCWSFSREGLSSAWTRSVNCFLEGMMIQYRVAETQYSSQPRSFLQTQFRIHLHHASCANFTTLRMISKVCARAYEKSQSKQNVRNQNQTKKISQKPSHVNDNLRIDPDNEPSHTHVPRPFTLLFEPKPQTERAALRDSTGLTNSLPGHTLQFQKGRQQW
mmetsp:Transcript_5211/g.10005  ORF Transcript_5211/g.10005 Transcript_5211/m.10005 type:complete len:274 (-) Transcript_5211:34-855(-)